MTVDEVHSAENEVGHRTGIEASCPNIQLFVANGVATPSPISPQWDQALAMRQLSNAVEMAERLAAHFWSLNFVRFSSGSGMMARVSLPRMKLNRDLFPFC